MVGVETVAFGTWFALVRPRWNALEAVDWIDLIIALIGQGVFGIRMLANHDWKAPDLDHDDDDGEAYAALQREAEAYRAVQARKDVEVRREEEAYRGLEARKDVEVRREAETRTDVRRKEDGPNL